MPKLKNVVPKYRKHRASGQAVVTLSGIDYYLGPYGSKASKVEYDRLVSEWLARGRTAEPVEQSITINELIVAFLKWARKHYRKNGRSTGTLENFKLAFRLLRQYYGRKSVREFGPKALKTLQHLFVQQDLSRRTVNDRIASIKQLFKWGASEELLPSILYQSLATVRGLSKGRTDARETQPVLPVADAVVDATVAKLANVVADMVRLQRLTGMRPAEVCNVRPCDVDISGDIWLYRPSEHKTEHHERSRIVAIGPQGQDVLRPYLLRDKQTHCFSPLDSERKRRQDRHAQRVIPISHGNRPGSNRKRSPKWKPGEQYTTDSYRRAIQRACDAAFPSPETMTDPEAIKKWRSEHRWHPNQLRHTAATEIRKRFGLEAAQVTLGHSKADVTQIYAEADLEKAIEVARRIG